MQENMGSKQKKIALGLGSAAAAVAIFVPLRYKWKGLLSAVAFSSLVGGITGFSVFNKLMGVKR
jgi:hypothetical protein